MRAWLLLVLAACGSKQASRSPPAPLEPAPAVADCTDVGVILRGEVESEEPEAGPAKEKVYATSCAQERWAQAVIDCIASTPAPRACLDGLDAKQRAAFEDRLQAWQDTYGQAEGDDDTAALPSLTCDDVVDALTVLEPPVTDSSPERDWQLTVRKAWLRDECEHGWSEATLACIVIGARIDDADAIRSCVATNLDAAERDEVVKQLAEYDRLAAKIAVAKRKPAAITCKKAVAVHYGDRAWRQKLDGYKPADRKKMIAASRDRMTKACTVDSWSDTLRACLVAGGGDTCFETTGMRMRWGYPAAGAVTVTGVDECDEYAAAVQKIAACKTVPQTSRDALQQGLDQMLAQVAGSPADKRAAMATNCAAGLDAINQMISSVGC